MIDYFKSLNWQDILTCVLFCVPICEGFHRLIDFLIKKYRGSYRKDD